MISTFPLFQTNQGISMHYIHKFFCFVFFFIIAHISIAQPKAGSDSISVLLKLSHEQTLELVEIDKETLNDMHGMKERAVSGYNPPADIQYQHKFIIIRRLQALEKVLTTEQYQKIIKLRFDISPDSKWFASFYKTHKLPTIEQAVAKKQQQLQPKISKQ